jgi:hypothetical protein
MAKTYDPCRLADDIVATVADANRLPTNRYPNAATASNRRRQTAHIARSERGGDSNRHLWRQVASAGLLIGCRHREQRMTGVATDAALRVA